MLEATDSELQNLGISMFFEGGGTRHQARVLNPDITKGEWRWMTLSRRSMASEDLSIWQLKLNATIDRLKGKSWKRRRYGKW